MSERGVLIPDTLYDLRGRDLEAAAPGYRPVIVRKGGVIEGNPADVEVAFFSGDYYPDRMFEFVRAVPKLSSLRWLQSFGAGVDNPFFQSLIEKGIRVTTSSGANAPAVAQLAILMMLALTRRLPKTIHAQRARAWEPHEGRDVEGERLVVVGLGPIGIEVARVAKALRMDVLGLRRNVSGEEPCETWRLDRLEEALESADQVVLALPLVPDTRGLFGRECLARMKPNALLVNVGRGALVDETALVEALESGRIAGAGLDVFEVEPLPKESPLWSMPNVIVSPHHGGYSPVGRARATDYFLENLARYWRGEALLNEVTPS